MPSASAARCGVVTALEKMRWPGGKSLDPIEQQRRRRREPRRDLGDAADLMMGIGAVDAAQRAERIDRRDEAAQVLVHRL